MMNFQYFMATHRIIDMLCSILDEYRWNFSYYRNYFATYVHGEMGYGRHNLAKLITRSQPHTETSIALGNNPADSHLSLSLLSLAALCILYIR